MARNGTEDEQTKLTRDFARLLYCACIQRCGPMFTNVFLVDERYTSKLALARRRSASGTINNKLSTTKPSGSFVSSRWTRIDDDSACIILEDFYHSISTTTTSTRNFEKSEMIVSIPKETYQTCIAIWKQQQQLMQHARYNAQRERYSAVNAREEAMRRAKAMEETMKEEGLLGYTKKAQRKLKKQRRNAAPVTQKIE